MMWHATEKAMAEIKKAFEIVFVDAVRLNIKLTTQLHNKKKEKSNNAMMQNPM